MRAVMVVVVAPCRNQMAGMAQLRALMSCIDGAPVNWVRGVPRQWRRVDLERGQRCRSKKRPQPIPHQAQGDQDEHSVKGALEIVV